MSVTALDRDGNELLIKGTIYGTMPMTARLRPGNCSAPSPTRWHGVDEAA
jgi:hypothetical protein